MNAVIYQFKEKYESSTAYSRRLMKHLSDVLGRNVIDLTDSKEAQSNGYDFIVSGKTAEFKHCDNIHSTKNICFELISNSRKCTPGSALASKAELFFYYDTVKRYCHYMKMQPLKRMIETGARTWRG